MTMLSDQMETALRVCSRLAFMAQPYALGWSVARISGIFYLLTILTDGRLVGMLTRADLIIALERLLPKVSTQPFADAELRRKARVLVENVPGVRAVVDRLLWIEASSGIPMEPPKSEPR